MSTASFSATLSLYLFGVLLLFASAVCLAHPQTHRHQFVIQATPVKRLCKTHNAITVNGQFPGPTLEISNGDTLTVTVINKAKYNVTIHWHGIRQFRTGWADGPEFVTQCPIRPGGSYTYRFTVQGQEGTLWWHAHSSWLRATVYGALIIRPREGDSYPFTKPNRETTLLMGEWWDANPIDVVREATRTGAAPNISDAYTFNGQPGDLYKCSSKDTVLPSNISILQAFQQRIPGVITPDFPANPPVKFDYTGNVSRSLFQPVPGTKGYRLKYGSRVQVVLQDTSIVTPENHPIHLHGYDFYIVAEGFGNFNPKTDTKKFNLVDPPLRNTVAVPVNGWAVIRFVADNPGAWIMHCHLDVHITWGLAMVFLVDNGVGQLQSIEAPPADLPIC
ncbi:laccase-12 [Momordica charantia]|uniref:Laccase-12 n=1 Tax=Momordica charantia TaxID=3673 RepID=A0A6J1BXA5_MOMCH|nr:laccase-12 [Momordica charantia]